MPSIRTKHLQGTVLQRPAKRFGCFLEKERGDFMKKKIWIDLDNSPHVPFFKPIMKELSKKGFQVVLTARDCSQTCALADRNEFRYERIGRHFGKNKILKVLGLLVRALQLMPFALKEKPDLALSHGSRSQLILSWLLGIPSVLIFDYEFVQIVKPLSLIHISEPTRLGMISYAVF